MPISLRELKGMKVMTLMALAKAIEGARLEGDRDAV
jgi:hypothetical protein